MNTNENIAVDSTAKKRPSSIVYLLTVIFVVFFGILVGSYIATKRANPIMLDLHGKPLQSQGSH